MIKLLATACVILSVMLTLPAWAGFKEGWSAYKGGDYETALSEFRALSKKGNATAAYYLGVMYSGGQGVPRDHKEAIKWYSKAAAKGHGGAMYALGKTHEYGRGVPINHGKAMQWYKRATRTAPKR